MYWHKPSTELNSFKITFLLKPLNFSCDITMVTIMAPLGRYRNCFLFGCENPIYWKIILFFLVVTLLVKLGVRRIWHRLICRHCFCIRFQLFQNKHHGIPNRGYHCGNHWFPRLCLFVSRVQKGERLGSSWEWKAGMDKGKAGIWAVETVCGGNGSKDGKDMTT